MSDLTILNIKTVCGLNNMSDDVVKVNHILVLLLFYDLQ